MADTVTCPVCERPGVPLQSTNCPQCDADLTCFQALDTLAATTPSSVPVVQKTAGQKEKQKTASNTRRAVLLLLLLLALIGAIFFCFFLQTKDHMQNLHQQVVSLKTDLRMVQQQETEPAEQILCVLPGMEKASVEVEKEEDSFAEDDPLIYEEDRAERERTASPADDSKKQGASVSSVPLEEEGQETAGEKQQGDQPEEITADIAGVVLAARGPVQEGMERRAAEEKESDAAEAVHLVEPMLRKTRSGTLAGDSAAKSKNASHALQPLLPEKQWAEKTFLYLVKETDTLWDLAERFYGNGKYYPVIMEQNPRLVISNIHDEESLRLFNDRSMLKELYTRRIEWRDGLTLWKHQVQTGETRQSIERRFASPGASDRVFYERKPDISPGAIVRVILH